MKETLILFWTQKKLIMENKEAAGHDRKETQMILNHKDAFLFVREHAALFQTVSRSSIEQLHKIIVKDLSVGFGFREKPVGVIGSGLSTTRQYASN